MEYDHEDLDNTIMTYKLFDTPIGLYKLDEHSQWYLLMREGWMAVPQNLVPPETRRMVYDK